MSTTLVPSQVSSQYDGNGVVKPPRRPVLGLAEVGVTGLKQTGGFIWEEFLAKLSGQSGARVYREMSDNDAIIGATLFAIGMLCRAATFQMQSADDSAEAMLYAERMQAGLFDDMEHTWAEFMGEVMSELVYGYALHEIVLKVCRGETDDPTTTSKFNDGFIMPRKLAPRSQETIWRWIFNANGDAIGAEQIDPNGAGTFQIPLERCLHFRTTTTRNNPEGKSVLRPAYISYLRKKLIEDAEGRAAMRTAGVVVLEVPQEYFDASEDENVKAMMQTFRQMAKQLAADRQGSCLLPSTTDEHGNKLFDVRFVTAGNNQGSAAAMGSIVDRLNKSMAMTVLADFIMLGQNRSGGGSHALSVNKTDMFTRAIETFLTGVCDVINRKLLTRIWKLNQFPPDLKPTLTHGGVQVPDIAALGAFIQQLAAAGAELFPNEDLQNSLLTAADLPTSGASASQ
jgi:hypothetical protein